MNADLGWLGRPTKPGLRQVLPRRILVRVAAPTQVVHTVGKYPGGGIRFERNRNEIYCGAEETQHSHRAGTALVGRRPCLTSWRFTTTHVLLTLAENQKK